MPSFDFVVDGKLRQTLENALEYIFALYRQSKDVEQKPLYQEETCRVMILYVVAVVEAVLLYVYKTAGGKLEKVEYKFVEQLPKSFAHREKDGLPVVIAVQEIVLKKDYEIGLHDLVQFFREQKYISQKLAEEILELNDLRNTFHLSKVRKQACDIDRVEAAFKLLVEILENASKYLGK